jgi:hypothetical protein
VQKKIIFSEIPLIDLERVLNDEYPNMFSKRMGQATANQESRIGSDSEVQNSTTDPKVKTYGSKGRFDLIAIVCDNHLQLMAFLEKNFAKFPIGVPKFCVLMKSDLRELESGLFNTQSL